MAGSELEPNDSRNVTGTAHTPDGRWSGDAPEPRHGGELEPNDSRNVTGAASTPDGRWTNEQSPEGGNPAASPQERPVRGPEDQDIPQTGEEDPLAEVSTAPDYSETVAAFSQSERGKNASNDGDDGI